MKKVILFGLIALTFVTSCANYKVVTKKIDEHTSFKKPLIVIPFSVITENTSIRIEKKFQECFKKNNITADFYLLEIKQEELKLNEEKKTFSDEILSNVTKNNNDGVVFLKYDTYNYGAYGVSFLQEVFAYNLNPDKLVWYAKGYATYGGIPNYCEEITNKMIAEKLVTGN